MLSPTVKYKPEECLWNAALNMIKNTQKPKTFGKASQKNLASLQKCRKEKRVLFFLTLFRTRRK